MANLQNLLLGRLLLSCCKRLMFKLKSSNRGQPGHAIWNNIRWKKARGQTSTWVCSTRERRRRRSACSEFGIGNESFLSYRKLPIQAVTCSGGPTCGGFYARWRSLKLTDVRELPLQKLRSFDWHNIMHDLILAELAPPKPRNSDTPKTATWVRLSSREEKRGVKWRIRSRYVRFARPEPWIRRFTIFTDLVQREGDGEVKIQYRKAQAWG